MMFLQVTTNPTAEIAYSNINLVTGCIAVIVALSSVIVFLYKEHKTLQKEFRDELKASNETLIKMNNSYNLFVQNLSKMTDYVDLKKER